MGYVGLANALLLSQKNFVKGVDIDSKKVISLNNRISPIKDTFIQKFLDRKDINFYATENINSFKNVDLIMIATPTNYDEDKKIFNTSSIEAILKKLSEKKVKSIVIIKSTIPFGFTNKMKEKFANLNLLFSPEFLREGHALQDCLEPSRIVVGVDFKDKTSVSFANQFLEDINECIYRKSAPSFVVSFEEAEISKLFANTYLAMRVAFFNELDNFALKNNIKTKNIIECISSDERIGDYYNNPSFGFGGYCLPKDVKQLSSEFDNLHICNNLIKSITTSNKNRKIMIVEDIIAKTKKNDVVGVYRLIMKSNSDNCRSSAMIDIVKMLSTKRTVIIYEPFDNSIKFDNCTYISDLSEFKRLSTIIVCNRFNLELDDVKIKVYSRDIYGNN